MSAIDSTVLPPAADELSSLSVKEIRTMDFSRVVGYTNEPNMPSGGAATVRRMLQLAGPLRPGLPLLEVGSNTGYTSIELASWTQHQVYGIDVNPLSNRFAAAKAARTGIDNVTFKQGDGMGGLPFAEGTFGLVFVSNVTSFMDDHAKARDEYYRVVAPLGVLASAPIYYRTTPPATLVDAVSSAIGVKLPVTSLDYWKDLFSHPDATLIAEEAYQYERQTDERIASYLDHVMAQPHLLTAPAPIVAALRERLGEFYRLFDENLSYAGYSILVNRLHHPNPEPVLHTTRLATAPAGR